MNFDHENKNQQIMLFCFLLAICFLFMPWSGNYSGGYRASYGIEDYGVFFLLPWIATARWIYKNEPYNKYLAFALALLHTILIFIRIFTVKYAFIGLWLTSACSLIWLYCCYKEYENNKASNNSESKKIRGNRASKADTSFNTNDYVKLEPISIFKYITRAYFYVAAADGKIDSSEEDNLKNYLGSLATDLSDGDQNKFLNYCYYFDEI